MAYHVRPASAIQRQQRAGKDTYHPVPEVQFCVRNTSLSLQLRMLGQSTLAASCAVYAGWTARQAQRGASRSADRQAFLLLLGKQEAVDLAPIQRKLPEELLLAVLAWLPPYELGRAQVVCKQWRALCGAEPLWQPACAEAFRMEKPDAIAAALRSQFRCHGRSCSCAFALVHVN